MRLRLSKWRIKTAGNPPVKMMTRTRQSFLRSTKLVIVSATLSAVKKPFGGLVTPAIPSVTLLSTVPLLISLLA